MLQARLCLFWILIAAGTYAQVTTASVGGMIKDESGAALPSAAIAIRQLRFLQIPWLGFSTIQAIPKMNVERLSLATQFSSAWF